MARNLFSVSILYTSTYVYVIFVIKNKITSILFINIIFIFTTAYSTAETFN